MSTLSLLESRSDWDAYRRQLCQHVGIDHDATRWGNGPAGFPCLVLSYVVPNSAPHRIVSCYVYPDDARRLLSAAGGAAIGPDMVAVPRALAEAMQHRVQSGSAVPVASPAPDRSAELQATLQSVSAHLLALVSEMISVGATSEERYEKAYSRYLALSDRVLAERADLPSVLDAARKPE